MFAHEEDPFSFRNLRYTQSVDDSKALASDVAHARRLGMGAKLCIHPRQVDGVNTGFMHSQAEVQWAQRVVASVQQHGMGATTVDGKLVDRPVWLLAQSILSNQPVSNASPSQELPNG